MEHEIDIELLAFVKRCVTSAVKRDIVVFFGQNPYTRDTASGVAQRIGRSLKIVWPELRDLVLLGLLEQADLNGETVYQLTVEKELRETTFRFVERVSASPHRPKEVLDFLGDEENK
jgi:hypothetical protein